MSADSSTSRLYCRIESDVTVEGFEVIHVSDDDTPYTLQEAATDVRFGSDIPYDDGVAIEDFDLHHDDATGYLRDDKGRVYGKEVTGVQSLMMDRFVTVIMPAIG
jgi:hypothetical protein